MKIKVLQENLNQSLNHLQKAIPGKPQLPILASIHIQVKKNECILSATDLYLGVRSAVQAEVDEVGEIVVPGKEFREIIASLPPGAINLDYTEGTLKIKSKKTKVSLQCYSSEDYPAFPEVEGDEYALSSDYLKKIEQYILFSASNDQARPVLTAVLFAFNDDGLRVVSTDGFRLSLMQLTAAAGAKSKENEGGGDGSNNQLLVPAKALGEAFRISSQLEVDEVRFKVSEELKQVFFSISSVEMYVRLIEGSYPPYEKIIPPSSSTEVVFDTEELMNNIKRAMIFARESSNIIKFEFSSKGCLVSAESPTLGSFVGDLEQATISGGQAEIAFNARYLLDFLQATKAETVKFAMTDSLKPAVFTTEDLGGYRYVVMPFKVNR